MKKKSTLIIIIVLVVVLLAGGGAAAYFLLLAPKDEAPPPKSAYVPGDYFVTNCKDTRAMVKTTIVLEVNKDAEDEEFTAFMTANNHIIRDTIVFILRDMTEEELRAENVKEELTSRIVTAVNENLGIDNVQTIYFNDYVVQ